MSIKRMRILAAAAFAAAAAAPAGAEDEGLTSEKAAVQVFESVKTFMGDTAAMEKMSRSQKLDFVLTSAEDRIKKATAEHFESNLKSQLEDYAKKSLRAKAFLDDAVPKIRTAAMSGKPFDWSLIDSKVNSKVDTQMAALAAAVNAAKTGYEVFQSFTSGGTRAGLESLGKAVSMSLVEAYVPGWGQVKLGAELVQALGDYVLAYANDTARAGMIADMYPEMKSDPGGFARWILNKSPADLAKDVAQRWDDNAVEYGRLWQGKGTEAGAEKMKQTIADQLLAMRSEVVLEQGRQRELEHKLKEPGRAAQAAEDKLQSTSEAALEYSLAALRKVRDFKAKVHGLERQDAEQAAEKVAASFEKARAELPGAGYSPLPTGSLVSHLGAATSEIKDSYSGDGYDFVKHLEALAGYADSRKSAIASNEQQVVAARKKAEEAGAKAQSAMKPVEDKLKELWDRKWAFATGKHDASTSAQIAAIEKAMGPLMEQRDEMSARFRAEIAPLEEKAAAYAALRGQDLAALAAAENVVYLEARDRNTRMTAALEQGLEDIQKKLDAALLEAEEAALPLNALDALNYASLSGSYVDLIKTACAIPAGWDYPNNGVPQRAAWIESERRKVRDDLETLRKLEPVQAKACGGHKQEVERAREAFKDLIAEGHRKMYYNEANFAEFWEGLYPASVDKVPSEVYQRADSVSRNIPVQIFQSHRTVYARRVYNCARWERLNLADYTTQLAALDKASLEMQPIIAADETGRRLNSALGDLMETFRRFEPAKPGQSDKEQALAMYQRKEGKLAPGLDPLKSDGNDYLQEMKKVWEENKRKAEAYENLKKAYAGTIKYQYGPETTFPVVDRLLLIPQRIKAFEDALTEASQKNQALIARLVSDGARYKDEFGALKTAPDSPAKLAAAKKLQTGVSTLSEAVAPLSGTPALGALPMELPGLKGQVDGTVERLAAKYGGPASGGSDYHPPYQLRNPRLNSRSAEAASGTLVLMKNDLVDGAVTVTGRLSELDRVFKLLFSEDGGVGWKELPVQNDIAYTFNPTPLRRYQPVLRIETDDARRVDLHFFPNVDGIVVRDVDYLALVAETIKGLADSYERRDIGAFGRFISDDYLGNKAILEEGVRLDFDLFLEIRLAIYIDRIDKRGDYFAADTRWDKTQVPRQSGQAQKTSGKTTMVFALEDGRMRIQNLRGNLIYATLSAPIAEASGLPAAVVDAIKAAGESRTPTQPGAGTTLDDGGVVGTSNVESGVFALSQFTSQPPDVQGYTFATKAIDRGDPFANYTGDFWRREGFVAFKTGHFIQDLGAVAVDSVSEVPASGYSNAQPTPVQGHTYALQMADGTYAAVEITLLGDCLSLFNAPPTACTSNYKYRYQRNGTRAMQ